MFSRITGVGSFLPGPAVSNDDLARRGIETSDDWITSRTGIRFRHLAADGQTASDLGLEASQRALQAAGLTAADIDLIIVATSTPDFIFPVPPACCNASSATGRRRRSTSRPCAAVSSMR
jgi:3-oxoacyl-[acyl-carrier-protein] synthase-3